MIFNFNNTLSKIDIIVPCAFLKFITFIYTYKYNKPLEDLNNNARYVQ